MNTDIPYAIFQWIVDNPWIFWLWLAATLIATALRAGYPKAEERPRWIVMILAVVDLLQGNLSGPVKLFVNRGKTT